MSKPLSREEQFERYRRGPDRYRADELIDRRERIWKAHQSGKTMVSIAKDEALSPERIRQILAQAKRYGYDKLIG